ncbi:MAG: PIG-L deacetylase family protein [Terriglobia bacterium]|jgi:LmbE family N-acetylglucosaminyl deacetylase
MADTAHEEVPAPLRILAIGAHPDDVELCCAGTLARCVRRGDRVAIAILCNGNSASSDLPPEDLVKVRSLEARNSAGVLGAELMELGLSDWCVDVNLETKKLVADAIRQVNPDVVLTHFNVDYGSDHNNTFILVRDAALAATVPNVRTSHLVIDRIPSIFMWEPLGGYNFQPEIYVDITPTFETKAKMLGCHTSQREWMRRYGGIDFAEYIKVVARFRGYQAGVEFAEGFVPLKNWENIRTRRELP